MKRYRLGDLLRSLKDLDPEKTIFADKIKGEWTPESRAWLVKQDRNPTGPMPGYFLEVAVALEVLDGWSRYQIKRTPTPEETVTRIIYYATYDA